MEELRRKRGSDACAISETKGLPVHYRLLSLIREIGGNRGQNCVYVGGRSAIQHLQSLFPITEFIDPLRES
jgi:hypothetical protein